MIYCGCVCLPSVNTCALAYLCPRVLDISFPHVNCLCDLLYTLAVSKYKTFPSALTLSSACVCLCVCSLSLIDVSEQ